MDTNTDKSRPAVRYVTVNADDVGQRLDNYLLRILKGVPRTRIYSMLRRGEVRVNRGRIKPSYRITAGDEVRIPPVRGPSEKPKKPPPAGAQKALEECVIFEDKRLLVIDKPAGLAVHGGSGLSHGVIETLRASRPDDHYLELVHRLDKETSGCLLVARRRSMLRAVHALLREGQVDKRYLALVQGQWHLGTRWVDVPLATHERTGGERHVTVHHDGKPSRSRFKPVQILKSTTLMEVQLDTGRTHQIRVHAAHMGHPVAGDNKYGDSDFNADMKKLGLERLFLHAQSMGFELPESNRSYELNVPLPELLRDVLNRLEPVA